MDEPLTLAGIKSKINLFMASSLLAISCLAMLPAVVHANTIASGVTNAAPAAKISFTFDDGLNSAYTQAAPTLAKYGLTGTDYVITGCVGMTTVGNTCRANPDTTYMTWAQVQALQNTYGWEIGSHTVDHDCLASNATIDPSDCQTNSLTTAQIDTELSTSKTTLAGYGITALDFSPPYGDYNNNVIAQIAKYYQSMRNFANASGATNSWPGSDYYLQDYIVQETTTPPAVVESAIDKAIANNTWLVLTFHDIKTKPSKTPDDYEYGTSELDQIAAYVKAKQTTTSIQSVHVSQGLVTSTTNLLPNSTFNDGIADGWTTDNSAAVTKDTANNGSYPDPTNSIKFTANSSNARLYSPRIAVDPKTTYMLKNFLNVQSLVKGDVEFYIDEFDANGNWISGQYKGAENSSFVEDFNFQYTPSSPAVVTADLQITVTANSGIVAYFDNAQWFPLSTTGTAGQSNLLTNGTFDGGLTGWITDDATNITADATSNGAPADPINSVKMVSSTKNTHLFSTPITVDSTKAYTLTNYLNVKALSSGVVGFYIDEYDANGNWISGQYKTDTYSLGGQTISFGYKPSSANVKSASLQVILVGNSSTTAYFDDATWYVNAN